MDKIDVLVIPPYAGLTKLFTKVANEYPDIEFHFYEKECSNIEREVAALKQNSNIDAIICSGEFGKNEQICNIPVIGMKFSFSDIFYAFKTVKNITGKHAFVCYSLAGKNRLKEYAASISEVTNHPVDIYDTDDPDEIDELLENLSRMNYSIIFGGKTTFDHAQQKGLNCVQIACGVESVRAAVDSAWLVFRTLKRSRDDQKVFLELLQGVPDYLAIQNPDGSFFYNNGSKNAKEFNNLIKQLNDEIDSRETGYLELESDNVIWSVTKKPSQSLKNSGQTILYFRRLRFVDTTGGGAITYMHTAPAPMIANVYSNTNWGGVKERIEHFKNAKESVLISGERGLGKENVAFLLNDGKPMIRIDSNNLTLDSFNTFVEDEFREMCGTDVSAILIANADVVVPEVQGALADFLTNIREQGKIRIISTAWDEIYRKVTRGSYNDRLYRLISRICIDIPPVRNFINEIDDEISFIISALNIELGTQIVGIHKDALTRLKDFTWEANLLQLVDVLRRSMLATGSSLININEVERMLAMEKSVWSSNRGAATFWKGSLEDIERRIIRGILEDENMNQTKAAKRLEISRSTLWKKIK